MSDATFEGKKHQPKSKGRTLRITQRDSDLLEWGHPVTGKFDGSTMDPIARGFCRRGKYEVAENEGHEQAGKADRAVITLRQNPLAIGSVDRTF